MSMIYSIVAVGGTAVATGFQDASKAITSKANRLVRHHGQLLRTKVMANASGRPGPNAPTGDYRRSISLQMVNLSYGTTAYVGTNLPQGRRLEFGFHGADSLGRVYNQAPLPHFGPAFDAQEIAFVKAAEALLLEI